MTIRSASRFAGALVGAALLLGATAPSAGATTDSLAPPYQDAYSECDAHGGATCTHAADAGQGTVSVSASVPLTVSTGSGDAAGARAAGSVVIAYVLTVPASSITFGFDGSVDSTGDGGSSQGFWSAEVQPSRAECLGLTGNFRQGQLQGRIGDMTLVPPAAAPGGGCGPETVFDPQTFLVIVNGAVLAEVAARICVGSPCQVTVPAAGMSAAHVDLRVSHVEVTVT